MPRLLLHTRARFPEARKQMSPARHPPIQALDAVQVLASLSPARRKQVAETCKWRCFAHGEQILGYRDPSTDVHFLAAGRARVIIYSLEGKAVVFTDLAPGAMFGEMAAIDRGRRSASVEALQSCTTASLTSEQFEALMLSEPTVAMAVLRSMTAEVRRLSERVFEFSTLVVQNRIQAELLRLASGLRQENGEVLLSPAPSLSEVASRISTHREAVSRELSRLTSIGLLTREAGGLRITSLERLAGLVRDAKGE